jgi:hypothetical protein
MKGNAKWLPLVAALTAATVGLAASPKLVCNLTGKEVKTCCCETLKGGKFLCKLTGKTLDKCCCTGM